MVEFWADGQPAIRAPDLVLFAAVPGRSNGEAECGSLPNLCGVGAGSTGNQFPASTMFVIVGEATPPFASFVTANMPAVLINWLGLKSILILPFGST